MSLIRRRPRELEDGSDFVGLAVGVFGALLLSVAMLPLRGHLHNANMALALVVPVLLAGVLGGRWAGALSAGVAALCFDFFFTQPYLSLRIASGNDIASAIVLVIVGVDRGRDRYSGPAREPVGARVARGSRSPLPGDRARGPRR